MGKVLNFNSVLNISRRFSTGCFDFDVLVVGGGHAGIHRLVLDFVLISKFKVKIYLTLLNF